MEKKTYYLGLDMGTNSVGWAVTDTEYNLIRVKGKDFWGVREFEEANVAVERRSKRTSRRRYQREVARVGELKRIFADAIEKEDADFYLRLDNSKYFEVDKDEAVRGKNAIFNDNDYDDAMYYKDYPTIFHLRKALLEDKVEDKSRYARLVYLALLNMFRHRGHFLENGMSDEGNSSKEIVYSEFVRLAYEILEISLMENKASEVENILADRKLGRSLKAEKICEELSIDKSQKKAQLLVKAICGLKIDAKKLFDDLYEMEEKVDICFEDYSYDENAGDIESAIGSDNYELIDVMKQIHDAGLLANILHGEKYLSCARINEYNQHKEDLKLLKNIYKKYKTDDEYDAMFRKSEAGSYSAYVLSTNSDNYSNEPERRDSDSKARSREDLYKRIKKDIDKIEDERVEEILNRMQEGTFLPKQLTPGNGIIPNQVHRREMKDILKVAEKYLPFLSELDASCNMTGSEKILALFSFQIPYYVGPVTEKSAKDKGNGWVIRKEAGKVYPWNINEKIDMNRTQEEFIRRLIRDCTYIAGEKVLPLGSLLYEKYKVLNEINNISVDGNRISVEHKQRIYKELFCKKTKVTKKDIEKFLNNNGYNTDKIGGIDTNINNQLKSYHLFKAIFGDDIEKDKYIAISERIIELCTIYGDTKKTLRKCLENEFADILNDAQIKRITGYKFKDWAKLSKAILELPGCDTSTGEIRPLIRTMWEENKNFMEVINEESYKRELEARKKVLNKSLDSFTFEDLDDYYFSAPVKRMINQTLLIIKEIIAVMGCEPERIFVEMTRNEEDKKGDAGRKDSRSKQLIELYKNIKGETRDWAKEIQTAGDNGSLRSKKLYLYYTQMGKCMYTGQPIDLEELFTTKYDIDHIYPRRYVKDDNIGNNLVLVNKAANAYKSDNYPLEQMDSSVYSLWYRLKENGLITEEKYKRLTGKNELTEEQKAGFIARQLVETSQGTKGVSELLKQLLPNSEIVYAKARNVSDFRNGAFDNRKLAEGEEKEKFLKSRLVNDFHHAKDAYLNIVVGNVYFTKFTQNPMNFIKKEYAFDKKKNHYNLDKMYKWNVIRNGYTAWIAENKEEGIEGTIATVRKVMEKNTPLMTRLTFTAKGAFSKETLYSAKETSGTGYIPFKSEDVKLQDMSKYGGYTGVNGAYFFLVEHTEKKKRIRTLEVVPVYLSDKLNDTGKLLEYCMDILKLTEPRICIEKIKMQSVLRIDGYNYRLSGRTGKQIILRNDISLCLNTKWINYIKKLENSEQKIKDDDEMITKENNNELYSLLLDKHCKGIFSLRKNPVGTILEKGKERFEQLSLTEQCSVILEILKLSVIGPTGANLKAIGGSERCGVMLNSKEITKSKEFVLINQSVTGLYTNIVDMLKI